MTPSSNFPRSVLVVDDDPFIRDLLHAVLEDAGFEITHAANGAEALRSTATRIPNVVILDVMMPGLDGLEVCRAMRSDPRLAKTRIIMLTARASPDDREAAMRAGADAFFPKPFSALDLIDSVSTAGRGVV